MFARDSTSVVAISIGIASILGVLTRVYVNWVCGPGRARVSASETAVFFDLFANILGCAVLGFHTSLSSHCCLPAPLNRVIATGYAGSVTTFASWNYDVTRTLVKGRWLDALAAVFLGLSASIFALVVGRDIGDFIMLIAQRRASPRSGGRASEMIVISPEGVSEKEESINASHRSSCDDESSSAKSATVATVLLFLILASLIAGSVSGAVLDRGNSVRRSFWTSVAFAPIGALARWQLSSLNVSHSWFPLGTFAANLLATTLDSCLGAVLLVRPDLSVETTLVLSALITGLGGSLSTVSTWLSEALAMQRHRKYLYVFSTIVSAQAVGILVYGTAYWITEI